MHGLFAYIQYIYVEREKNARAIVAITATFDCFCNKLHVASIVTIDGKGLIWQFQNSTKLSPSDLAVLNINMSSGNQALAYNSSIYFGVDKHLHKLAVLAQMVACLPLVQQVRGSIPGRVVNFHLKIFNLWARRSGDVHFLITRLYITVMD